MQISAELTAKSDRDSRGAERRKVAVGAGLRRKGATGGTVGIVDLSVRGFQAETPITYHVGSYVWLKLPGLEASLARVVWSDGRRLGGEFQEPLHPAIVERFASTSG